MTDSMEQQIPLQFEFSANKTFENFHVNSENSEIINHLANSAEGSGENLIFLWSTAGNGKSHLLQSCCCLATAKHRNPIYLNLREKSLPQPQILDGLEALDIVCIDGLEAIAGNAAWEQALFSFFLRQQSIKKQLVIAARQPANVLPIKLPDLQTRLNSGLTLKLHPLSEDERLTVLVKKAKAQGFELTPQVGRFLLQNLPRDLPSLLSILESLDFATLSAKRKLTLSFLKEYLNQNHG